MFLGVYFFANNASMDVGNLLGITRNAITAHVCRKHPPKAAGYLGLSVKVPSARDGGVTGIMIHVMMNADKGAGNTERHALSSSAWRFATRILDQA